MNAKQLLKVLANGATVVDAAPLRAGGWGILADASAVSPVHPYVTWVADEAGDTFWGHYFLDLAEARADYHERLRRGH